ncbi:MAG: hypothetical protein IT371_31830 [Deltaproteobacteria bacterium]|nr:hypothetical protein [Deltaproteobacteria bacterium]
MTDVLHALCWCGVLGAGLAGSVLLHRFGLRATYVRDLLHVGAGLWVFSFSTWKGPVAPLVLVLGALMLMALLPLLARTLPLARAVVGSVTGEGERWQGLVLYTVAHTALTTAALTHAPFPAGAALWALALGDGLGGAVGRHLGRLRFRVPGGKIKTVEGSLAVGLFSAVALRLAGWTFAASVDWGLALEVGLLAALVEALSPRGTDNLFVPGAVWTWLLLRR